MRIFLKIFSAKLVISQLIRKISSFLKVVTKPTRPKYLSVTLAAQWMTNFQSDVTFHGQDNDKTIAGLSEWLLAATWSLKNTNFSSMEDAGYDFST